MPDPWFVCSEDTDWENAMGFDAHVLKVLIASPGDTGRERDAIEKALHGWNTQGRARADPPGAMALGIACGS